MDLTLLCDAFRIEQDLYFDAKHFPPIESDIFITLTCAYSDFVPFKTYRIVDRSRIFPVATVCGAPHFTLVQLAYLLAMRFLSSVDPLARHVDFPSKSYIEQALGMYYYTIV